VTKDCSTCWNASGTIRETDIVQLSDGHTGIQEKRFCTRIGMMIVVLGQNVASCSSWQPKLGRKAIAEKANATARKRFEIVPCEGGK